MPRVRLLPALCLTVCFFLYVNQTEHELAKSNMSFGIFGNKNAQKHGVRPTSKAYTNNVLLALSLIISGDIHPHPGPTHKSVYPCGLCQVPVTWSCEGVCCDGCDIWYHKSCTEQNSTEFAELNRTDVAWHCYKCDSVNVSSFSFHSYEFIKPNSFEPLANLDETLDQSVLSTFSPRFISSPANKSFGPKMSVSSFNTTNNTSSKYLPCKSNLRVMNVNCRSLFDKKAEFQAVVDYTKPDIIIGTESWLEGIKPGKPPSKAAIKNCEVFSDDYQWFRNDRDKKGGGVFIGVHSTVSAIEQPELVTNCEIAFVKLNLKSAQDLYVASYYMPHRNLEDLNQLNDSLNKLNSSKPKHILLGGDFNCPDINWEQNITVEHCHDRNIQETLVDLANNHSITQVHSDSTRDDNLLDLMFTSNPSLVKSSTSIPGISDHDITITDLDIRPQYVKQKKRKVYKYNKANWEAIASELEETSNKLKGNKHLTVDEMWNMFKTEINNSVEKNVPSKFVKGNYSPPWLNRKLRNKLRKKAKLYKKAKSSKNWDKYKSFQKACKKSFRKAEQEYIVRSINKGFEENNNKPFWRYIKSKKQDNIGVSPLKKNGALEYDSKAKAEILVSLFRSVFTKSISKLPFISQNYPNIDEITVSSDGVCKLLQDININKAMGPDLIPNIVLKSCANELSSGLATIFNKSLETGYLPNDWRDANVTPIYQKRR